MKAIIEINGSVYEKHEYEGDSVSEIVIKLIQDQDLDCLVRMGLEYGDDVSELVNFVEKFHNGSLNTDDIRNLNINLSIGTIRCLQFDK